MVTTGSEVGINEQLLLQQNLLEARINETITESRLTRTIIRTPISGKTQNSSGKAGKLVTPDEIIVRVIDTYKR